MRRIAPLALAAALIAPAAGATLAEAAGFNSTVTIRYLPGGPRFSGRVGSAQALCVQNRRVTVYRRARGADPAIGSDTSSAAGNWNLALHGRPRAGYYYARAKSRTVGAAGSRTVCRAARSAVTRAS
ncbi:MAG: hypothetical protein ACXWZM_00205 [Solirubrobacterales bacterium]